MMSRSSRADQAPTWLVTGGAGYVGRHVVLSLLAAGHRAVVFDDLSSGDRGSLPAVPFVLGSITDAAALKQAMTTHRVAGVIHLAAHKSVSDSIRDPLAYYRNNAVGTLTVAEAMVAARVKRLVHSSSAAVYGAVDGGLVGEDAPLVPINPYGETKLVGERLLRDVAAAHGIQQSSLRYFNVAGTAAPRLRDTHGAGLIPAVLNALVLGVRPVVYGIDHDTPDGSCIRDYVHVSDIASAHRLVAQGLLRGECSPAYNVGTGHGVSVLEILDLVERITKHRVVPRMRDRRPGDPARVVAATELIQRELGWRPAHPLEDTIRSEWLALTAPSVCVGRAQQEPRPGRPSRSRISRSPAPAFAESARS
jgi:UDP-glucose 4-epimerase